MVNVPVLFWPMHVPLFWLLALASLLAPAAAQAQARLNLRLEPEANQHRPLLLWSRYLPAGGRAGTARP